jgi:cystathionine beta-synthase
MRENQLLEPDRVSIADLAEIKPRSVPAIVATTPGATVRQALRLMSLHDVSQLPVMDGDDCVGSVSEGSMSARALEDTKLLDATVSDVMDPPFPVVDGAQQIDSVVKLLNKANPAVLVRQSGRIAAIVTRSDVLHFMMAR